MDLRVRIRNIIPKMYSISFIMSKANNKTKRRKKDYLKTLKYIMSVNRKKEYVLGTATPENMSIEVSNAGSSAYSACVRLYLLGARVQQFTNAAWEDDGRGYKCILRKPLKTTVCSNNSSNLVLSKFKTAFFTLAI